MEYIKNFGICVYYNRFTFIGYILVIIFIPLLLISIDQHFLVLSKIFSVFSVIGTICVSYTGFGLATYKTFYRVLWDLQTYNDKGRKILKHYKDAPYCDKQGAKAAVFVYEKYYKK